MPSKKIDNNFKSHDLNWGQILNCKQIREDAKELAKTIDLFVPECKEKELALTRLEEAMFWANAGIARQEDKK